MTKLSSRLQSRIAKRRASIRGFEQELDGIKLARGLIQKLDVLGLKVTEVKKSAKLAEKTHRTTIRGLADDQQLDKRLLNITYLHENSFYSLDGAAMDGPDRVIVNASYAD